MTHRFWYHLTVSAIFLVAVSLVLWSGGQTPETPPPRLGANTPAAQAAVLVFGVLFLAALARLLLRLTGSDRATGLLGIHAAAISLPVVSVVTGSVVYPVALLLVAAALLEALDVDSAPGNAVRSGVYAALAGMLDPGCTVVAAAIVPIIAWIAWPRWSLLVQYVLVTTVLWSLAVAVPGLPVPGRGFVEVLTAQSLNNTGELLSAFVRQAGGGRSLWEADLLSIYGAFGLAGLLAATVRRIGPSRRGVAATAWLLVVVTATTAVWGNDSPRLLHSLAYVMLILLANTGLAAVAAMNPLHAGRRRMIAVGVLFLLPALAGWVRLVV